MLVSFPTKTSFRLSLTLGQAFLVGPKTKSSHWTQDGWHCDQGKPPLAQAQNCASSWGKKEGQKGGWRDKESRVYGLSEEWMHCYLGALSRLGDRGWVLLATTWGIYDLFGAGSWAQLSSPAYIPRTASAIG